MVDNVKRHFNVKGYEELGVQIEKYEGGQENTGKVVTIGGGRPQLRESHRGGVARAVLRTLTPNCIRALREAANQALAQRKAGILGKFPVVILEKIWEYLEGKERSAVGQTGKYLKAEDPGKEYREATNAAVENLDNAEVSFGNLALEHRNNKKIVLKAIESFGANLEFASPRLKNDPQVVSLALKTSCSALQWAGPDVCANKELVLEAVRRSGQNLQYASPELQNDPEVVRLALKSYRNAIKWAGPDVCADKEIVLYALRGNGRNLQYASPELRNDSEVVSSALDRYALALKWASQELKQDATLIAKAARLTGFNPETQLHLLLGMDEDEMA